MVGEVEHDSRCIIERMNAMGGEPPGGGNGKPEGKGEKPMHPFQVILRVFEFFKAQTMDEDSLVNAAMAANCPTSDIAKRILSGMVDQRLLIKEKRNGVTYYSVVKKSDLDPRLVN